jgi:hypothetical protein
MASMNSTGHRPVNARPQGMLRQRRVRKLDADQRNDV